MVRVNSLNVLTSIKNHVDYFEIIYKYDIFCKLNLKLAFFKCKYYIVFAGRLLIPAGD